MLNSVHHVPEHLSTMSPDRTWERDGVRATERETPLNLYELTAIIRSNMQFPNQSLPRRV
ncbi:hypothetical protein C3709_15205 [Lelliottia aquatilis]|uniref:Uncharacterized protein n=1 Tax=Lelliottia aquatilis TaxID=2080838 RepID=A0ABX5A0C4_9ENTR|nr:hypothetical protein C3712_11980 [Lelliottia aquatilis]POZ26449.1 hypothetical protein C3708_10055 [Lelliottia sp. 7254-16]POZ27698.1 hypothetical protein C3711_08675 [Lelliottia aquatilis]POZ32246.1 hypothetical protein C3710_14290 [Lelliottia aquatilis]POZ37363.1 hypothetical protein C3709_15205 [Lelliottia aquatilis]